MGALDARASEGEQTSLQVEAKNKYCPASSFTASKEVRGRLR